MKNPFKYQLVTEKTSDLIAKNKFTMILNNKINKVMVKQFLKSYLNIDYSKVNIIKTKPKQRRRGRIVGKTSSKVKAVITLFNDKDLKSFEKLI